MLKIYWMLKKQYLKTQIEYRLNFCLMMIAGVVIRTLFMAITYIIFNSIPSIGGYDRNEVFLMFALFFISEGLGGIFYEGLWSIPSMAHNGELDMMLVRPVSPLVQILSNGFGLQGIGTLALGITALLLSSAQIAWFRPVLYLCLPVFILLGMVVRLSSYLLSASHVFFLRVGDRILGNGFKYHDYYQSFGMDRNPLILAQDPRPSPEAVRKINAIPLEMVLQKQQALMDAGTKMLIECGLIRK